MLHIMIKPFTIDRIENLPNDMVKIYFTAYRTYWDNENQRGMTQRIVDTIVVKTSDNYDKVVYDYLKDRGLIS